MREPEIIMRKQTIADICKRHELTWTPGNRRPREARQHEVDGPPRVRYAKMMKQWAVSRRHASSSEPTGVSHSILVREIGLI